jgi:biopolymer transport protein ExbB
MSVKPTSMLHPTVTVVAFVLSLSCLAQAPALTRRVPLPTEGSGREAVERAWDELGHDIEQAREALAAAQERVSEERGERSRRLESLRRELDSLRTGAAEVEAELEATREEVEAVEYEVEHAREVLDFVVIAVTEFRRAFETRVSDRERQVYETTLAAVDRQLSATEPRARLAAVGTLLELGRAQIDAALGGRVFAGEALGEDGALVKGRFAELGPVAFFAADRGGPVGVVTQQAESLTPQVFTAFTDPAAADGIRSLVSTGQGVAPLDITLGGAVRLAGTRDTLVSHLRKGGVTMVPLLGLALVCVVIAVYKSVSLLSIRTRGSTTGVRGILADLAAARIDGALSRARSLGRPLGPVLEAGIEHRDAPKEHVEEIMYERLLAQVPKLEQLLAPLAVCASAAPLLGLLGTVTGMIHTFRLITVFGTGDARMLSSGISEALITTEVGLIIAVPALLVHAFLSRRVRKTVADARQASIMFVNGLKLVQARDPEVGP